MPQKPKNISSDLQGISKLTIDAVKGTTKIVESLHATISQYTSILGDPEHNTKDKKTKGLTGMIYKSINGITHLMGEGIDAVLNKTSRMHGDYTGEHKLSATREAVAAAMNGVLGDHFEKGENPLAINMSFRINGQTLDKKQLHQLLDSANNNITLFIHGLCMNDLQWTRDGHNHGDLLAEELGHTIIYLHYNTGLHVSENGKQLDQLLNEIKLKHDLNLNIVAHSMGGLVARSACFYANEKNHSWLTKLKKIVFLGTPHHGAMLAKGGHWADVLLQISPYSAPFAKITKVRSSGLTDLRHGYVIDEQWQEPESLKIVPLPENIQSYAIATTASEKDDSKLANDVIGDGLVTINSALGIQKSKDLNIPKNNQWIGRNISHMQLLSDENVYLKINEFISDGLHH